jgi:hypothetical protein
MIRSVFSLLTAVFLLGVPPVFAAAPPAPFFNGFETNIEGWDAFSPAFHPTRVPSGTNGVTSRTGAFHATAAQSNGSATNWGGYSATFPASGFKTRVGVYLDPANCPANDTRFDWTSAINNTSGAHRRDFAFNAGCYTDTDATGSGPRFVFSASNNTGRGNSFPKNPGRDPFAITATGWYVLEHDFQDNGIGVLVATLSILDNSGNTLHSWPLSDPSDLIGVTVGGNRYGWFASQEFSSLAFDDSERTGELPCPEPDVTTDFRDVRRANNISAGPDLGGTGHTAMNFTGSAGAAGDTWITVYDETPGTPNFTGSINLSADVLSHAYNNKKGAGLLALHNEIDGKKGLALIVYNSGNTDSLVLATLNHQNGTLAVLKTVSLGSAINQDQWYRLSMDVAVTGPAVTVTGTVRRHPLPGNADSPLGTQVGGPLTFSGTLGSGSLTGVGDTGEVGIVASATGAVADSSVANFSINSSSACTSPSVPSAE